MSDERATQADPFQVSDAEFLQGLATRNIWPAGNGYLPDEQANRLRAIAARLSQSPADTEADREKWQHYERNYILPCFQFAKDAGIDLQKLVSDTPGKNCVELLVAELRSQLAARDAENRQRDRAIFDAGFKTCRAYGDNFCHFEGEQADKIFEKRMAELLPASAPCTHDRLNEEGYCRSCGADCRGIASPPASAPPPAQMPEPVAWRTVTEIDERAQRHTYSYNTSGYGEPLYVTPAPAAVSPDVDALRKALEQIASEDYEPTPEGSYTRAAALIAHAALSAPPPAESSPCRKCGKLGTKMERGIAFTVCDECWDKAHASAPPPAQTLWSAKQVTRIQSDLDAFPPAASPDVDALRKAPPAAELRRGKELVKIARDAWGRLMKATPREQEHENNKIAAAETWLMTWADELIDAALSAPPQTCPTEAK